MLESLAGPAAGLVASSVPSNSGPQVGRVGHPNWLSRLVDRARSRDRGTVDRHRSSSLILVDRDAFQTAGWFREALWPSQAVAELSVRVDKLGRSVAVHGDGLLDPHRRSWGRDAARSTRSRIPVLRRPARSVRHGVVVCSLERWGADDAWRGHEAYLARLHEADPTFGVLFVEPAHRPFGQIRRQLGKFRWRHPFVFEYRRRDRGLRWAPAHGRIARFQPVEWVPRSFGPWAERWRDAQVVDAALKFGLSAPALIVNDPDYATLARRVDWPIVADLTDDWEDEGPLSVAQSRTHELELVQRAGTVLVPEIGLSQAPEWGGAVTTPTPLPGWRRTRRVDRPKAFPSRPTIVYPGAVTPDVLDTALLYRVAIGAPDVAVVAVGPVDGAEQEVARLAGAGVMFLGVLPVAETVACMQAADLLVLPLRGGAANERLAGLIALEIQAVGVPAVATALDPFVGVPGTDVATPDDFVTSVLRRLSASPGEAGRGESPAEVKAEHVRRALRATGANPSDV